MPDVLQGPGRGGPAPIGIVYNTSMARPDAALALAALYVFGIRRQARVGAVCVSGAGLDTAVYCDIVSRFYTPGPVRSSNSVLPVGLAAVSPLPPDAPMIKPAVARTEPGGGPTYARSIQRVSDTSQAEAVLRNGVIFSAESAVVLSAPATWLARSLDLAGTKDQYKQRVKRLVIVESSDGQRDPAALRKVIAEWPTPVVFCGRDVGDALLFPGSAVDAAFGWAPAHPIGDAYRAFRAMPYDASTYDLAAMHYTSNPDSGFFQVSEPGTLSVTDSGMTTFTPGGGGAVRRITADPSKRAETLAAFVEIVSTKPPPPPAPRGRGAA
jgi:hypothetical protein